MNNQEKVSKLKELAKEFYSSNLSVDETFKRSKEIIGDDLKIFSNTFYDFFTNSDLNYLYHKEIYKMAALNDLERYNLSLEEGEKNLLRLVAMRYSGYSFILEDEEAFLSKSAYDAYLDVFGDKFEELERLAIEEMKDIVKNMICNNLHIENVFDYYSPDMYSNSVYHSVMKEFIEDIYKEYNISKMEIK